MTMEEDFKNIKEHDVKEHYVKEYAVSVIVPVYKAENFIEKCVTSLMEQTMENIEFVFVDDCSPDRSMEILENVTGRYRERENDITVVRNTGNCGPSICRYKGIMHSHGKYIIFCDSDDYVEKDMYSELYRKAEETDADMVWCDFIDEFGGSSVYRCEAEEEDKIKLMMSILSGKCHGAQWNKLIRRNIAVKSMTVMKEGLSMWEDLLYVIKVLCYCNKIAYTSRGLYHYNQQNISSLLSNLTVKKIEERVKVCNYLQRILTEEGMEEKVRKQLFERMLLAKMEYITEYRFLDIRRWNELWPYAIEAKNSVRVSKMKHAILNEAARGNNIGVKMMALIKYAICMIKHSR